MIELFRATVEGFKKYPLATVCGVLVGAVGHLWINNDSLRDRLEAKDADKLMEIRKCVEVQVLQERTFNAKIDSILRDELRKTEAQIKEMEKVIKQIKRK